VYIPISNRPAKVPDYLSLDPTSAWHVSALQAVGVESMTLSSRLRTSNGRHGTLQDIEDTINSTGKRRIAKFEMSIADPDILSKKTTEDMARAEKVGSTDSRRTSESETHLSSFDFDAFTRDYRVASHKGGKKDHIFARAEACRGAWSLSEGGGRNPRDRYGDGPGLQRYVPNVVSIGCSPCHGPRGHTCPAHTASYRITYGTTNDFQIHHALAIPGSR
jgi:hypothetical protein